MTQNPLKLSDFDFPLPENLIAQTPADRRDQSRLMIVHRQTGHIDHDSFSNLEKYLTGHPLMVFNDTKVLPAKLTGHKKGTGKKVEVLLIREEGPNIWEAMIKGLGKLKPGAELIFSEEQLTGTLMERKDDRARLKLSCPGDVRSALEKAARMPLPPYIHRETLNDEQFNRLDRERYQTVYARTPGAIAAPTAGLHFTPKLLEDIKSSTADIAFLTLHVGVGTFQPVRVEDVSQHRMEKEFFNIPVETWDKLHAARNEGRKILAVGTTSTRVLEGLDLDQATAETLEGETERFIYPGYKFKSVNELLTNFHLPKSTLFMLVCTFGGMGLIKRAYTEAVREKYRFFSYGDAMLIL